jgi:transposase InsO family protein
LFVGVEVGDGMAVRSSLRQPSLWRWWLWRRQVAQCWRVRRVSGDRLVHVCRSWWIRNCGVQYLSIRYSERLAVNDIVASVGSRGDSYDNALVESFNGLYKWELIYRQGPWRGLDDVEFATMAYVDWFNHRRLHGGATNDASYTTPAEFEAAYYRQQTPAPEPVTQ